MLAIALAASSLLIIGINAFQRFFWFRNSTWGFEISNSLPWLFFVMLSFMTPLALALVFVIILATQTREQLTNWRAQIIPGFRKPHVRIGTGVFCLVAIALAVTMYVQSPRGVSLIGTVAISLMPLTLIVWIAVRGSVWMIPVAVVACIFVAAEQSAVLLALMLATLTPGLTAAAIGAERWRLLGFESLFPNSRRAFVREMGLVMAINFAEFWLAGMAAAVIAIAAFTPREIASASFAMTVLASALTQVLLFGGLFLLGASRSAVPYLIGVSLLMIGVAMPLEMAWAPMPELSVQSLLRISVAEAVLGIALLLFARNIWECVELE